MQRTLLTAYAALLVLGCGSAPPATTEPVATGTDEPAPTDTTRGARVVPGVASAQPGRLSVRVETTRAGQSAQVGPGDSLHSGDRFVLHVSLDREAYIHVIQFFADGSSAILSSADGTPVHVTANSETRIPPAPHEIELDDAVGEENLYVLASERPLDQVDSSLARFVDDVHTSSQETAAPARPTRTPAHAARPARPAPDLLAGLSRGAHVVPGSRAVEANADERGVIVARFSFRHVR